ncbi:MAG TPA: M23 family metallopeptidase [Opitutaceae bacterium]|nr:M23 family metallopeptidase [Opitutaceae bacterium]
MKLPLAILCFGFAATTAVQARLELAWPTPNTAYLEGRPIEAYIQPTVSGDPESGLFGCVRSGGQQFHEGIDLKPIAVRDRGEPTDEIFAAMDGVVRHVATKAGQSSYGRYIVVEHPSATPACYSLYAHLSAVRPGLRAGTVVQRGEVIGTMGRSAGGYTIPRDRAHLHFELGLVATQSFQPWYERQKFGSPNLHGEWNGMNLMGFDPRDFFDRWGAGKVNDVGEYIAQLPVAVTVRVVASRTPDFAVRYPSLVKGELPPGSLVGGWEVDCYWTGLPLALRPLSALDVIGQRSGTVKIVTVNHDEVVGHRAISLLRGRGAAQAPGKDLLDVLGKLFGPVR